MLNDPGDTAGSLHKFRMAYRLRDNGFVCFG
jgi:hypothetical protein